MRPVAIPLNILQHYSLDPSDPNIQEQIKSRYQKLSSDNPEISIVIPAYNEEASIVQTLSSLCANKTSKRLEIIVVNNNSKDRTAELVEACGVKCITETTQGITPARNCGLKQATGVYILNADADTIYPPDWIEEMTRPLQDPAIALTYGKFSFIPIGKTKRPTYFFYEYVADFSRSLNAIFRNEAVNVYGFNSGFRRLQGKSVNGFDHPPGSNEDGWLAEKLRTAGYGRLFCVTKPRALVWTTDRRIQIDGGLLPALKKRIRRILIFK